MDPSDNHTRAQKMVNDWPSWKRDVSLTKHSVPPSEENARTTANSQEGNNPIGLHDVDVKEN